MDWTDTYKLVNPDPTIIRVNGFDITRERMPSEEFYSGNRTVLPSQFAQREESAESDDE